MAVTRYRNLNGRIRGESSGSSRTTYLTDALGSVTATLDASANVVNTYRNKPYGQRLAKTGSGADPRYQWTGDTGSRVTGLAYAEQYNRRRHLGTRQAGWTSVDALWPWESMYGYVSGNPATWRDPSGLKLISIPSTNNPSSGCCGSFLNKVFDGEILRDGVLESLLECMDEKGYKDQANFIVSALINFKHICGEGDYSPNMCLADARLTPLPSGCAPCNRPEINQNGMQVGMVTFSPMDFYPHPGPIVVPERCDRVYPLSQNPCLSVFSESKCNCSVFQCYTYKTLEGQCSALFHESIHCGGVGGPPAHYRAGAGRDIVYTLSCCLCQTVYGKGNPNCERCRSRGGG